MGKPVLLPLAAIALMGATISCATDDCTENQSSRPLAGFYSATVNPKKMSVDSITVYGIGAPNDSLLANVKRNVSEMYLPFRIDETATSYVIRYEQKDLASRNLADTITFSYDLEPFFVSTACGAIYKYEMQEITHTRWLIDSVTCPAGEIDNLPVENLRIYFRTAQ